MIVADDVMAEESGDARKRVAQNGAADVADVHWFGQIGRAKVDHDFSRRYRSCDSEPLVRDELNYFLRDRLAAQNKVNETDTRNRGRLAKIDNVQSPHDLIRECSGIFAALFSQNESGIGLVIAKARICRWS